MLWFWYNDQQIFTRIMYSSYISIYLSFLVLLELVVYESPLGCFFACSSQYVSPYLRNLFNLYYGKYSCNLKNISIIKNNSPANWCEIVLGWLLQNLNNEKTTFIQVMPWCHQATTCYMSQRYKSPYGVTKRQGIKVVFVNIR